MNNVAVVTGGSAGIGKAICERLLAQDYEVVSLARRRSDIDHPKLHNIEVDLMDRRATAEVAGEVARRFAVTTVVHNAGVIRPALRLDLDRRQTVQNSMTSPYLWVLCLLSVIPSILWWNNTPVLGAFLILFAVSYVVLYCRILKFRTPKWLRLRQ